MIFINLPRKERIDTPGALHHVIVRGIERRKIFEDIEDRWNKGRFGKQWEACVRSDAKGELGSETRTRE